MTAFKRFRLPLQIAALFSVLPSAASADAYTSLTYGFGPDEYRSYAFKANVDIFKLPLILDLDHFLARAADVDDTTQSGLGLTWNATKLLSANYHHSVTGDGTYDVTGNESGLTFGLNTLWQGELRTTVDLGYGDFEYEPTAITRTRLASLLTLQQKRKSAGFSQDITPSFTIFGSHDQYEYDRDYRPFAVRRLQRPRNVGAFAFTLLSFPDKTNTLGMIWKAQESLTLDLSTGKTTTILEQLQRNTRLGADFQINDKLNLGAAITGSSTSEIVADGVTLQQATRDTYTEITAGWAF
ncbi:MAG: hypothetical protein Q7U91_09520 [Sideroxyarcus sp.]|nr:hypothetical protein [Sideroxyarcus sp.]